jgi:hypothetical protein
MNDRQPFDLPPDREVSPQLRARVLHQALSDTTTSRPRPSRWLAPVAVGLGAAAVVLGVVVLVSHDDGAEGPPAAGNHETQAPHVEPHEVLAVNLETLEGSARAQAHDACMRATPVERAGLYLSSQLLRGSSGPFMQLAYATRTADGQQRQFFCTPYGVTEAGSHSHLTSLETPIEPIAGSRVSGVVAGNEGSGTQAYFDGAWFAVSHGVAAIEARVVVGSDPGVWHATKRWTTSYLFASTWRTVSPSQNAAEISVQYRAITTDGQILMIPGFRSTTVGPDDVRPLVVTVDGLTQND